MGKRKQVTIQEWELAIRKARAFINNYDKVRWKIVDIALSVCEIKHGGRVHETTFTLSRFAAYIELNRKTLMEWVRVKKLVVDKLPDVELKDKTRYSFEDLTSTLRKVNPESTPKEVLMHWKDQLNIPPFNKKFIKYRKHLDTILYNAQNPMRLMEVDEKLLLLMADKCDLISKLLKKEVEFRKNFSVEQRLTQKNLQINKAVEDASAVYYE